MQKKLILIIASLLLSACGRTIVDRVYPVTTVVVNTLKQPVTITQYNNNSVLESKAIQPGDSVLYQHKSEVGNPYFANKADSAKIKIGPLVKTDYPCFGISSIKKPDCNSDPINILNERDYRHESHADRSSIYRYAIGIKDSLETVQEQKANKI